MARPAHKGIAASVFPSNSLGVVHAASDHAASLCHFNINFEFVERPRRVLVVWPGRKNSNYGPPSCGLDLDMNAIIWLLPVPDISLLYTMYRVLAHGCGRVCLEYCLLEGLIGRIDASNAL